MPFAIVRIDGDGRPYWVTPIGAPVHASEPPPGSLHYGNPHLARQDADMLASATYRVVDLTVENVAELRRLARGEDADGVEK